MKILLVSGGTGGHIWPAITFGRWIEHNQKGVKVQYMSGVRPLELEIYGSEKITPFKINVSGSPLGAPKGEKLKRWREIMGAFWQTKKMLKSEAPDLCVLFGGYISLTALLACRLLGIPAVLHEQNAQAGRVTRLAAVMKTPVASGWKDCYPLRSGRFTHVGVPVRAFPSMSRSEAWRYLNVPFPMHGSPVVAVMTGSLGSRRVSGIVEELSGMKKFSSWSFLMIDHEIKQAVRSRPNLIFLPKMWDIAPLYNMADLLITRGGASSLSEVVASGIPAVVVPWRRALDDHQMKNSLSIAKSPKIFVWDEEFGTVEDLSAILSLLHSSYPNAVIDINKKMYNVAERICTDLWRVVAGHVKGDVRVGGK